MENLSTELIAAVAAVLGGLLTFVLSKVKAIVLKSDNKIDDAILAVVEKAVKDVLIKAPEVPTKPGL